MEYLNPLSILNISPEKLGKLTSKHIKNARKRLLAEFELNEVTVLKVKGGREFDRTSLLKLLNELEQEELRTFHMMVYKNQGLCQFLEAGSFGFFTTEAVTNFPQTPAYTLRFVEFIAPYFSYQYNKVLHSTFRKGDWENLLVLCTHPLVLPDKWHSQCYADTLKHLVGKYKDLESYTERIEQGMPIDKDLYGFYEEVWLELVNTLPEYFMDVRDRYALKLRDLAIAVNNVKSRPAIARMILYAGLKLDISQASKDKLQYILDQLPASSQSNNTGGSSKKSKAGGSGTGGYQYAGQEEGMESWQMALIGGAVLTGIWLIVRTIF